MVWILSAIWPARSASTMMGRERQARRCFHPPLPLTHHAVSLASGITLAGVDSADYRRARLSALPGGGAFGCGSGLALIPISVSAVFAASSLASPARSGSRRGGVRKFVVFDGAPDCRCYRGNLVAGEA